LSQQIKSNLAQKQPQSTSDYRPWHEIARPEQLAPAGSWRKWLVLAGRGYGKSRTINEWAIEQALTRPGSRGALVAATAADVRDVVMEGESGIMNISSPDFMPIYKPSLRRVIWPNGSIATTYSADEPDRLRGPQHHWATCDELAAWRRPEAWDMLMFGLRLGNDPRVAIATTPRPTKIIKDLVLGKEKPGSTERVKDETVVITRGTTYDNRANLADAFFSDIISAYEGTRLGEQELNATLLTDIPGALWKFVTIADARVSPPIELANLLKVAVAIDPAVTSGEGSNETGIVVAGVGKDGQGYVLEDCTLSGSPDEWATVAIKAYLRWEADEIVAEKNNGGDMIENTIRVTLQALHRQNAGVYPASIPYTAVHASRGKRTRAEPVSALYEQGRVHHVGVFGKLEDQMTTWLPDVDNSPDRMDALVWALTKLMLHGNVNLNRTAAPGLYTSRKPINQPRT
jgi:phage terminase large subunit-like protein